MKDNALPKIKQADEQILIQAARTLMAIMEQRDSQLNLHCGRVANNCANFCESHLSASPPEVAAMYLAGVLHDIGMIFLPHLTRKIGFSLHDQVSDFDCSELESAKLLDADAKALEAIAREVKTTIDDLQNIIQACPTPINAFPKHIIKTDGF